MVELETVSLENNAAILSIGAVVFDERGVRDTFYSKVDLNSCVALGLHVSDSTMEWWSKQDQIARQEAFSGKETIQFALQEFTEWLGDTEVVIYGNGATADNIWLANAYVAANQPVPWKYYNSLCYRTLVKLLPPNIWHAPGIAHHALEDAISQARTLIDSARVHGYDFT